MLFLLLTCTRSLMIFGTLVILGMDVNDDVRDCAVSVALSEIGIQEAVIKNHRGESVPATCARNTQRSPIDSFCTSPELDVLICGFFSFHIVYGLRSGKISRKSLLLAKLLIVRLPQITHR